MNGYERGSQRDMKINHRGTETQRKDLRFKFSNKKPLCLCVSVFKNGIFG